ncbi:hypothetical protein D3C79_854020 [compost metagenome]
MTCPPVSTVAPRHSALRELVGKLRCPPLIEQRSWQREPFEAALGDWIVGFFDANAITHHSIGNGKGQVNTGIGTCIEVTTTEEAEQRPRPTITQAGSVAAAVDQG